MSRGCSKVIGKRSGSGTSISPETLSGSVPSTGTTRPMADINFLKITDPRDIEFWIAQQADDPKLQILRYQLEMAKIGEDWREHGIVDDGQGYRLLFNHGYGEIK